MRGFSVWFAPRNNRGAVFSVRGPCREDIREYGNGHFSWRFAHGCQTSVHTWSDNKVRKLATACLPWQQWTDTSVCFDDVGISSFHTVLLLIYGSPLLSGIYYCLSALWCAIARMSKLLVKLGKSGSEIREMLVQVCCHNVMKRTAIYKWVTRFSAGRECHWRRDIRTASSEQNWRKHCKISSNFAWKSSDDRQEHSRVSEHQHKNRKILIEYLDMRKVCAKMIPKDLLTRHCLCGCFYLINK
jgi:hypothetical protein